MSQQLITIKSSFNGDLRRFSVPAATTLEGVRAQLQSMYQLDTDFTIKYVDDESDLISITSTEELVEAFRLSKDLRPPLLRLTLFALPKKGTVKAVEPALKQQPESNEYPPLPVSEWDAPKKEVPKEETRHKEEAKESNEYPPLPVSEWDAPQKKKPVLLLSVKIPESIATSGETVTIPISISAQMKEFCAATAEDVQKHARQTMQAALPLAQTYFDLSDNIAKRCVELSDSTAAHAKLISALQAEETARTDICKETSELSQATKLECQKRSMETAAICKDLVAVTLDQCKGFCASSNARLVDTTANSNAVGQLSGEIRGKCGQLSAETSARSAETSAQIRKLIMEM